MQFGASTIAWLALFMVPLCSANLEAKEVSKDAQSTEAAEFGRFGGHFGRFGGGWGYPGYGYGVPYLYNRYPYIY